MKNQRNKKIMKVLSKTSFFVLTLFLLILSIAYIPNSDKPGFGVNLQAGSWNSNLAEITGYDKTTEYVYKSIKDFVVLDNGLVTEVKDPTNLVTDKTIIMLNDGLDVYYFSEVCNKTFAKNALNKQEGTENNPAPIAEGVDNPYSDQYLGFTYTLGADIDYEDASSTFKMLRPIGWEEGHPFSGTFDGRGFTISNIFYRPFEDIDEYNNFYSGLVNLAWFSVNTGTIMNLGIINPNVMQYDVYDPAVSISPFIGANRGIVKNCFVQDLRGNNAGMLAEGGYQMAMFAIQNDPIPGVENTGIISNCYVAADRISAESVSLSKPKDRYPFVSGNKGTIENCYYDESLLISSKNSYNTETIFTGVTALTTAEFLSDKFNYQSNVWHSDKTYGSEFAQYMRLKYPVLKGLRVEVNPQTKEESFLIEDATDFVYMSQLIDQYQPFRKANYILTSTIDMNSVKKDSFVFTSSAFTGSLTGRRVSGKASANYQVKLANNIQSDLPSIINLSIDSGISYQGNRCYGLFGILSGTVKSLNIVNATINQNDLATPNFKEVNSVGTVCGILINGTIEDVHVLTTINLSENNSTKYIGKENAGGISGASINGKIEGCTASGTITAPVYDKPSNEAKDFNHSIGGILGVSFATKGINNCLNNITITAPTYSYSQQGTQFIGGVIGSGNIKDTFKLQNNADIIIPNNNSNYYSTMYIGGVIGKVGSANNVNGMFLNNANITYNVNDRNTKAYISGVMNVISDAAMKYDTFNISTQASEIQKEIDDTNTFEFKSLTNAGTLNINNGLSATRLPAKYIVIGNSGANDNNTIDIRTAGIAYSYLTNYNVNGAYNLDHHFIRDVNGKIVEEPNTTQEIDISMIDEFGPTFNADNQVTKEGNKMHLDTNAIISNSTTFKNNPDISSTINLQRVYNYRDITYNTKDDVNSYMLQLSGSINGHNFNLTNIRNEGDIRVYITAHTHNVYKMQPSGDMYDYFGDVKKMKVYGVMEEVSVGHHAQDIYNGGNIVISSDSKPVQAGSQTVIPNFNLYISGICYKNFGEDVTKLTAEEKKRIMLPKGYTGSLDNCINNGNIRVTSGDISAENFADMPTAPGNFYGQSRIGGITCINSSTISSTFNLGNVYNINNVKSPTATSNESSLGTYGGGNNFEVESGGICFTMQNEKRKDNVLTSANIIDSANNGNIVSMNTDSSVAGWINAAGFIGRNDRGEDNKTVDDSSPCSKSPQTQKIEYSINYGDIIGYNTYIETNTGEQQAKSSGIICLGACSLVDVINYGNIFSNRLSAGIFGYLKMERMSAAGASETSPFSIANAINYGSCKILQYNNQNVTKLKSAKLDTNQLLIEAKVDNHATDANGALIGMMSSLNSDSQLKALKITNLVNFDDELDMLGGTSGVTDKFNGKTLFDMMQYMATTKIEDTSNVPFSKGSKNGYEYGIKSYSKDTANPDHTVTNKLSQAYNGGIYNESYTLRTAPPSDGNPDNTNNYIADFIQFIPFSKVNDALVEKIGLTSTVIKNAFENAKRDYRVINTILKQKNNQTQLDTIYNDLITTYSSRLNNYKTEIIRALEKDFSKYTRDELIAILGILMQSKNDVNAICDLQEVSSIIDKLIIGLTPQEANEIIIAISGNDANLQQILSRPSEFKTYIDLLAKSKITKPELNALNVLYGILVDNNTTLTSYIKSLTPTEKDTFANELYTLLQNNQFVKEAIGNQYYGSVNYTAGEMLDLIITNTNGQYTKNENISDEDINKIYNTLYAPNVQKTDIDKQINSMTMEQMISFVNELNLLVTDTTTPLYKFLNDGRNNATIEIILPTSRANLLKYMQRNNYNVNISEPNSLTAEFDFGAEHAYSGKYFDITGTTPDTSYKSIRVDIGKANGNGLTGYEYWAQNGNSFVYKTTGPFSGKPKNAINIVIDNTTGIYAKYDDSTKNYTDVTIGSFISYSTGNSPRPNNGDLTIYMLKAMKKVITGLTPKEEKNSLTDIELQRFKEYFVEINKSTFDRNDFNALVLKHNPIAGNVDQSKLEYIYTTNNANKDKYIYESISSPLGKYHIVNNLYKGQYDYTTILDTLLIQLSKDTTINKNKKNQFVKKNIANLFGNYSGEINDNHELLDNIKIIINAITSYLPLDKQIEFIQLCKYFVGDIVLDKTYNNLTVNDLTIIISNLIAQNPELLNTYNDALKPKFKDDTKALISSYIIMKANSNDTVGNTLFSNYIFKENTSLDDKTNFENFKKELENVNIPANTITDFTGIYALASSYGIEDGLFLPDNIKLIEIDPIQTIIDAEGKEVEVKDHTWRGGTTEDPNGYDPANHSTINYKIYHQMKQLKKSIATKVFEIELTDINGEATDQDLIVKNDTSTDYTHDSKLDTYEVRFYIPLNHDILLKQNIYINKALGHSELSYKAIIDQNEKPFVLQVPTGFDPTNKDFIGQTFSDTFIVKAEDRTVQTTYTVIVTITEEASLTLAQTNPVTIDGSKNPTPIPDTSNSNRIMVTTPVSGHDGFISVKYTTHNMANGLDLLPVTNVFKTKLTSANNVNFANFNQIYQESTRLTLGTNYTMDDFQSDGILVKNGIVNIKGVTGTGFDSSNNTYKQGEVQFGVKLNNKESSGVYLLEVAYNSKAIYYTFFEKAKSDQAILESITYNNYLFPATGAPDNNSPQTIAKHTFGKVMTESDFTTLDPTTGIPSYLDDLKISDLATFNIDGVTVDTTTTPGKKIYIVKYTITAENGTTTNKFNHYITEEDYRTDIKSVYINGRLDVQGPLVKDPNNTYIYENQFEKSAYPSYRFEYYLTDFFNGPNDSFFSVELCDASGNTISDTTKEYTDLLKSVNPVVTQGKDFEVIFNHDSISQDYYFKLVYKHSIPFGNGTTLNWEVPFDIVKITKNKNRDSYIDNIVFNSENVIASTRTMIDIKDITYEEYNKMLSSPDRPIVCLPGKIHYNQYEMKFQDGVITKQPNFYVIGLVNKTMLDFYSPSFTLPEGAKIFRTTTIGTAPDEKVYKYVPYYSTDKQTLTTFLVSEDNSTILTEDGLNTVVSNTNGNINTFTYNNVNYTISEVAGYSSITIKVGDPAQDVVIQNTSLMTNYTLQGCFDETPITPTPVLGSNGNWFINGIDTKIPGGTNQPTVTPGPNKTWLLDKQDTKVQVTGHFTYVNYRCYAEIYSSENQTNTLDHVTDYLVATQDISNNIRFKVMIDKEAGCDINLKNYNVYTEFLCYTLPEGMSEESATRSDYILNNRAGLFAYFDGDKTDLLLDPLATNPDEMKSLQSNTSGYYKINMFLPIGYTFSYTVKDATLESFTSSQEFKIQNSIVAKTVEIHITIKAGEGPKDNYWGAHHEDDSIIKK